MTCSIVARDPATGALGVAVQSGIFGAGAIVPWARAGAGAVATQAFSDAARADAAGAARPAARGASPGRWPFTSPPRAAARVQGGNQRLAGGDQDEGRVGHAG